MTELDEGGRGPGAAAGRGARRGQGLRQGRGDRPLPRGRRPDPDRRRDVLQLLQGAGEGDRRLALRRRERRGGARGAGQGRGAPTASWSCPSTWCWGASSAADTERQELDGVEVPDGWMGLDIGPKTRRALRRGGRPAPGRCSGTGRWAPSRWSPSRAGRGRSPRRSRRRPARPWSAAATRSRRWSSSASTTRSTGSRPAAAPRWSCSRVRSCPGSRR